MESNELLSAFAEYDRQERIKNSKLGAVLAMILMPAGFSLDFFVYRPELWHFLELRLLCSALVGVVLGLLFTAFGRRHYRTLGMTWYMLPALCISLMIYLANDDKSYYYAGLNIVLLGVGLILPWTARENMLAVTLVILMYLGATFFQTNHVPINILFNNLYFLVLTGVVVVAGSVASGRLRFQEFRLRFELDRNKSILESTNEKLRELDQVKNRFFANISHELRTPLTLMLSPMEAMLHGQRNQSDAERRDLLTIMHANGMRLLKLINDLLDLVRLESGRMEVKHEPVQLSEFVKALASAARQVADEKKLKFETFVDPELGAVQGDRDKLEKIVLNLVFNALKFTPTGGRVELRAEKSGDEFLLIVRDSGVGIAEKSLPYVFDRFWQADGSSKRKFQGVGIGLALVKELAEIQGGKVKAESAEGKGATFTIRLPYVAAEAPAPGSAVAQEAKAANGALANGNGSSEEWLANLYRRAELFPATAPVQQTSQSTETSRVGRQPSVLVADDEPDMLRFLKSQLHSHYHVYEAVDGQQAVEKATQFTPDIILLDMMMPEKDGMQVCQELRAQASTQKIPIIMLTARADEETKISALSAGANDFLPKPFSTTELHVRVKNLIESHQYQCKLTKQNHVLETTIDRLKETETLLVQTEKMVSLGRMSAGIIHEINNPLNYATTGLFTLRNKGKFLVAEQQEEYAEVLHDVEDGINRVKNIISSLRNFTHPDMEQVDQVEVAEIVGSALKFVSNEWKDKVIIEQKLPERFAIRGNRNKLLQVFNNLLQNSLDAIRRKNFDVEKPTIWIEGRVEGDRTILTVRDNGEGIAPDSMGKVFDPFFTTKDVGEGTGLGLTICYRIVNEYDGRITVRSEHGKYCEFKLEFPACVSAVAAAA